MGKAYDVIVMVGFAPRTNAHTRRAALTTQGATGYTGKLIAEYLAEFYNGKIKWAIAGRSKAKLEEVHKQIASKFQGSEFGIVEADSLDRASMAALVNQTAVVVSAAGPFWKYVLLRCCVAACA